MKHQHTLVSFVELLRSMTIVGKISNKHWVKVSWIELSWIECTASPLVHFKGSILFSFFKLKICCWTKGKLQCTWLIKVNFDKLRLYSMPDRLLCTVAAAAVDWLCQFVFSNFLLFCLFFPRFRLGKKLSNGQLKKAK